MPGRLDEIIADLASEDGANFQCHKTVHSKHGGNWSEGEEGEAIYLESGNESMCIGSAIYMLKIGMPSVSLRFAIVMKLISLNELTSQNDNDY